MTPGQFQKWHRGASRGVWWCYCDGVVRGLTLNYFNTNIVHNHEHRLTLLNEMAEFANFCLSLTTIMSESDKVWYDEMKKSNICYDV